MGVVATFDHRPIRTVAIHGDRHSTATGRDPIVGAIVSVIDLGEHSLCGFDVWNRRACIDISSVEEDVHRTTGHARLCCRSQHRVEVVGVGVHVAIGVEANEVECVFSAGGDDVFPGLSLEHGALGDRLVYQLGALGKDSPGTQRVVPHFAVAHIALGGQANRWAMGLQLDRIDKQRVDVWRFGHGDGV